MKRIIMILLCIFSNTCVAQEVIFNATMFSVKDGLSDRSILNVTQDDDGFIWVGTGNGLNRFDGSEFKSVGEIADQLSSGRVFGTQKDKYGKLWLQKRGESVIILDPKKEELVPLPTKENLKGEYFEIINLNQQGTNIFLKNEAGKLFYLNESEEIVPYGDVSFSARFILRPTAWNTVLAKDLDSPKYEEINRDGVIQRSFAVNSIKYPDVLDPEGNFLRIVFFDNIPNTKLGELLWELEESGPLRPIDLKKDGRSLLLKDLDLSKQKYLGLTKDSKGNIWLSINEKLWFFDSEGNYVKDLSSELLELSNGTPFKINHLFIDDKDRLWMSSGLGLILVQVKENPFKNYFTADNETSTRGIIEVLDSCLLVNTYSGAKLIDKKTKKEFHVFNYFGLGLVKDGNGNIWTGQHANIASSIKEENLKHGDFRIVEYPVISKDIITRNIPFYDQQSGEIYLGTNKGLFLLDRKCACFKPYLKNNEFKEIHKKTITSFYANEKAIWLTTSNGIYQLDRELGIVNNFQFPYNLIKHIHEDASGDFWLATGGGGLIHWNRKANKVKQFTVNEGLSHNVLYAVYEDAQNNLWLPSNKGLMRFKKATGDIDVFQTEDGIPHEEFNTYSHYQGTDGKLYFGGLTGLTSFYPEQMVSEENHAPFLITEVQLFDFEEGQLLNKTKEVQGQNELILNTGDKFFIIRFSLLDYLAPNHIYAWKIEGLEEEWNYQTENSLRINALPYGNYNLLIKAKGAGGKWAKNELNLPITVLKPFYLRWQFIAFVIALISLLIYAFVRLRLLRLERVKEKLKGLVKERTLELSEKNKELEKLNQFKDKIYSIIAHDLRGPAYALQDIGKKIDYLMKSQQFERLQQFGETVDESITTLNTLLDNLLNWANQNMGAISLNPESLSVSNLLNQSIKELRSNMDKKKITVETNISQDLFVFADRQTTLTITRNLLSNAIKFTSVNGSIHLTAEQISEKITMINVIDHGLGIEAARIPNIFDPKKNKSTLGSMGEKGTGLGLGVSKELALLNGGDIELTSIIGEGSTFSIHLPSSYLR